MNRELIARLLEQQEKDGVKLVAVSKKHTKEEVDAMAALGVDTFGENRVQEFLEKYDPKYHWHIIGHLQTNKVKYIVGLVDLIESVDSIRLAKEIEKQAAKKGVIQDILVEVKTSALDENKTGTPVEEVPALLEEIKTLPHVRLRGLMTIASNTEDKQQVASEFRQLKEMFGQLTDAFPQADILSMGMSSDYPIAIEQGSNQIRIGTALFA